jgi:alpha-glucosidase
MNQRSDIETRKDEVAVAVRASDDAWWRGAVVYHIYPRSFLDTSGNGVGDLAGITRRLDYIASLGVDAIWISPFVKSPMLDFGYDVSDYLSVDPLFGTMEDFETLVAQAHARGLRVLMDQVLSHTSDAHPWFLESRESRDNPKADWYVWADPKPDGSPPNNWLSVFGGPSWQWEPRRSQYYLHNFLRQQPDLNFHDSQVQAAVLDACSYWLDRGVDGFRLDVCAFYFHDARLRDNPVNPVRPTGSHFMFNPYSLQMHVRDIAQPENLKFLERLRALCDSYDDRVLLGELHESEGQALHRQYTAPNWLQLAYGYWLLGAERIGADTIVETARALGYELDDGWPCWALDNHDFTRSLSRLGHKGPSIALTAALACLRGAMCIYQGAELGLPQADIPFERIVDPYGREFYPAYHGRDGSRAPMSWDDTQPNCGFSSAEPWLPITSAHSELSVAAQQSVPGSTLNRVSRFLNWRKAIPALRKGAMSLCECDGPILALYRSFEGQKILCAFNLGDCEVELRLPAEALGTPMDGHGFTSLRKGGSVVLPADEPC